MKTRRAISLVELLVAMSAATLVLTLSATLIHRAMHTHTRTQKFFEAERSSLRLCEQFRHDVEHAARATLAAPLPSEGVFLTLALPQAEETIEFCRRQNTIERRSVQSGKTIAREEFAFPAAFALELEELPKPARLRLTLVTELSDRATPGARMENRAFLTPVRMQVVARTAAKADWSATADGGQQP
jgi:hypothetical protein